MKERLLYLLRFYLVTVTLFILAKVAFMLVNHGEGDFSAGDMLSVVWHGLSLDLSTALYFLILPFLLAVASIWLRLSKWFMRPYVWLMAVAFALAFMADTCLYPFWHFKLDATCLQYLETPAEAMASVTVGYLLLLVLAVILLVLLIGFLYSRLPSIAKLPKGRWYEALLYAALIPLIVIGIRGGMGESTTNIGQVYFSQNQFLNHSAVNPVFSFLSSFEKTASYVPDYEFMSDEACEQLMDGLYSSVSTDPDTLLNTRRPDIVVILLESCGGIFTEDIGRRKDIMPRLNRLTREGVYFANFYANSYRTDRGTLCTWSGYPSFPTSSVMKMPAKTRFLPGLAKSLRAEGYKTTYLYGGDINFTNMRSYLVTTGFEQLHWMKDYTAEEQHTAEWGVRDDITFGTLFELLRDNGSPKLIGYSTLSSHEPWDVPTHRLDDEVLNAFNYLDECIGRFVDEVRQTPQWENLLVILLPDHGFTYLGVGEEHEEHDHVPMLWFGGAVKEPRRIEQLCNQTDLPATLLGQLGIAHDDFPFSRDVMSKDYTYPFAVHTYNNGITMKDSTGFAVFDLNANRIVVDKSSDSELLIRKGKAILQTAAKHLKQLGTE
jgi:phosphoglycerol transferase MdoB-like AlkP superfamily enzyme